MNFLNKMERKFGKYAIPNLSLYLILGYILGYAMQFINPAIVDFLTLNPYLILHGQIWRLVTWIIIPPSCKRLIVNGKAIEGNYIPEETLTEQTEIMLEIS